MSIPIYGNMSRPSSPEEGIKEINDNKINWEGGDLIVKVATIEFTSVCPTTGQPDFSGVTIKYKPNKYYIESKSLKFYLWSFRDFGAHCETLSKIIGDDLFEIIQPVGIEVTVEQMPRGGLSIISVYNKGSLC